MFEFDPLLTSSIFSKSHLVKHKHETEKSATHNYQLLKRVTLEHLSFMKTFGHYIITSVKIDTN